MQPAIHYLTLSNCVACPLVLQITIESTLWCINKHSDQDHYEVIYGGSPGFCLFHANSDAALHRDLLVSRKCVQPAQLNANSFAECSIRVGNGLRINT